MQKPVDRKFYEGKFKESFSYSLDNIIYKIYLKYSIYRAEWLAFSLLGKSNEKILDIGCGGGKLPIKKKGTCVTGLDISFSSLINASKIYDSVVLADIEDLPFKNEAFDVVLSFHLMGHIPCDKKDKILSEMKRVTKKNGINIHYIETDGDNFAVNFAKKSPELYRKSFIDLHGHVGLEKPSDTIQRISKFFKINYFQKFNSGIYSVEGTLERFTVFKNKHSILRIVLPVYDFIYRHNHLRYLTNFLLGFLVVFYNKLTPLDKGDWVLIKCIRKD